MRSAVSTERARPVTTASTAPASKRLAVLDDQLDLDARIGEAERRGEHLAAAEDARLAGDEVGAGGRVLGDEVLARDVAPRRVLVERGLDDAIDRGLG